MIFVKNKTDQTLSKLGVALGVNTNPKNEKLDKIKIFPNENTVLHDDNELPPIIKIDQKKLIEKQKEKENLINEKYAYAYSNNNIFSIKKKQLSENKRNKKNYVVKLKNNMVYPLNIPGCTPYDPYLINICKNAIINVKDELPNYKEIIKKINTEFGIEEGNNIIELNTDYIGFNIFNSFKSFSKTRTNFSRDKNFINTQINTFSSMNREKENKEIKKDITEERRGSKKK